MRKETMVVEEWVEVEGGSVEIAVKAALEALDIPEESQAQVEILREPQRGFLGIGRQDALVRVKPRPKRARKRSRGGRKRNPQGGRQPSGQRRQPSPSGAKPQAKQRQARGGAGRQAKGARRQPEPSRGRKKAPKKRAAESEVQEVTGQDISMEELGKEQAEVVEEFLIGLLEEFGLEGSVDAHHDGRTLRAEITGEQTEALIGHKASVMQAVHELTKTVVQRKTARNCRLRLDIAGYGEKRRQALGIYAGQLADQVLDEGGEIMLEPMNASDRKVVHDAIAAVDGVRSYSEGREPRRSVVVAVD